MPRCSSTSWSGWTPRRRRGARSSTRWAKDVLDEALRAIPDDVLAHTLQRRGHPGPEILKELNRGSYDLIVLGSRGRGRAQEGLLGSVNGYIHFHAKVPLPPLDGDEG
jgi:nucleotide-binding universal stress UspA family protein